MRRHKKYSHNTCFLFPEKSMAEYNNESYVNDLDLPLLDLSIIIAATNKFSEGNKIGEGGFGSVYWVIQYLDSNNNTQILHK